MLYKRSQPPPPDPPEQKLHFQAVLETREFAHGTAEPPAWTPTGQAEAF